MPTLTCVIERITFFNEENGYSVLRVTPEQAKAVPEDAYNQEGMVNVVGALPRLSEGEVIEFSGDWVTDPRYGIQFKAVTAVPILPTSKRGITRYLSDLVDGVGKKTAQKIVDHFGVETLTVLNTAPDRLYEVKGIRTEQVADIITTWKETHEERSVMIFLQQYGVTPNLAKKVYDAYGTHTIQQVQDNPYRLADDIYGVGFQKADSIAQEMGMKVNSAERVGAGLRFALERLALDGHTFAPRSVLIQTTQELLRIDDDPDLVDGVIAQELRQNHIYSETLHTRDGEEIEAIYTSLYYYSERGTSRLLQTLLQQDSRLLKSTPPDFDLDAYLNGLMDDFEVMLSAQQLGAVKATLLNKVSVLTGGPGTGKTTTLRMVIEAVEGLRHRVEVAAPTGRAAKRLQEATERPARTIHRMLGFQPRGGFTHDESNPLEADLLVLDETSMLDLILFYHVLKALPPHCHLLLVGDVDQLPSVGAGNVLRDVIESGIAHVTRLETIFRQDQRSHIVVNAHRINHGEMPHLNNESDDFFFFGVEDANQAGERVVDVVVNRIPNRFGYDPLEDIQVLAPMYRGVAGVNTLNERLQAQLNGDPRYFAIKHRGTIFRVGDKVMQTRNNYDKGVFNGDAGRIHSIDDEEKEVHVLIDGGIITYEYSELDDLILSYCISTHRSQGSEFTVVVMPVLAQHYMMLQRNLLYTAITRAKKLVVLVGTRQAVGIAVQNNKVTERYSGLATRLSAWLP